MLKQKVKRRPLISAAGQNRIAGRDLWLLGAPVPARCDQSPLRQRSRRLTLTPLGIGMEEEDAVHPVWCIRRGMSC